MTPAARLQAAITLLAEIERADRPADQVANAFLRARRYVGAKDRRSIRELAFRVVRARGRLDWLLARHDWPAEPRARVLAELITGGGDAPGDLAALCDGGRYGPAPLSEGERRLLDALARARRDDPAMPATVRGNYPGWLEPELRRRFAERLGEEMAALDAAAPVDLRVNEQRAGRAAVLAELASLGFAGTPTPYSPLGIRLAGRPAVTTTEAYRTGLIEIQDEGAQLTAFLVDAAGSACVVDYCAGAGGKTLALAARMAGRGRLVACDLDRARLRRMRPRLLRAGLCRIEQHLVSADDEPWPDAPDGIAERVLLDMPCSGTGRWRRSPDGRHRLTAERLARHLAQQRAILERARRLVKPGGRLIYATCSVLPCENEHQVECFLAAHPAYRLRPAETVWRAVLPGDYPGDGPMLQLTPARHGTDGFFVAILERTG